MATIPVTVTATGTPYVINSFDETWAGDPTTALNDGSDATYWVIGISERVGFQFPTPTPSLDYYLQHITFHVRASGFTTPEPGYSPLPYFGVVVGVGDYGDGIGFFDNATFPVQYIQRLPDGGPAEDYEVSVGLGFNELRDGPDTDPLSLVWEADIFSGGVAPWSTGTCWIALNASTRGGTVTFYEAWAELLFATPDSPPITDHLPLRGRQRGSGASGPVPLRGRGTTPYGLRGRQESNR